MTAKDKAEKLVLQMHKVQCLQGVCYMTIHEAKQCALICCDEIIKCTHSDKRANSILDKEYWQKVKAEINLL